MAKQANESRTKTLKSFSVTTLLKLVALQADAGHDGEFTIIGRQGQFKAAFGQGAPSQAETLISHDSLKSALVALLVESPTFAEGTELANVRGA